MRVQPEASKKQAKIVTTYTTLLVRNGGKKGTLHSGEELFNTICLHSAVTMIVYCTVRKSNLTLQSVLVTILNIRFNTKYSEFCSHNVFTCTEQFSQLTGLLPYTSLIDWCFKC